MTIDWEHYSRVGLNVASTATSMGFTAAKLGTKIGVCMVVRRTSAM